MQHRQSSSAAWPALATSIAGVLLFGALGNVLEPPAAAVVPAQGLGQDLLRCPSCGWIEAKRELAPLIADPRALKIYEYTLRMPDGSMSVFQETLPTSWRLGERVMLIESNGPLE